ncbi:MAG: Spy/CpxP family protein refolding chaperone [Cyanobacteria bacterium J06635_15]
MKRSLTFKLSLLVNAGLMAMLGWVVAKPTLNASASAERLSRFQDVDLNQLGLKQTDRSGNDRSGIDFLCNRRRDEYIEAGARFLELRLDLEANQNALLSTVKDTLTVSANESFNPLCADLTASEQMPTAPEKLAQYQALAVAANTVFGDVRPAFDSFYTALSIDQQRQLDVLLNQQNR